mmetsp:Transcript_84321/g.168835  ORF Transcript_84321/g.168835 Transcript_84321/m.168835 type:complete len:156 (+) Transcript_84321:467-934(+)
MAGVLVVAIDLRWLSVVLNEQRRLLLHELREGSLPLPTSAIVSPANTALVGVPGGSDGAGGGAAADKPCDGQTAYAHPHTPSLPAEAVTPAPTAAAAVDARSFLIPRFLRRCTAEVKQFFRMKRVQETTGEPAQTDAIQRELEAYQGILVRALKA